MTRFTSFTGWLREQTPTGWTEWRAVVRNALARRCWMALEARRDGKVRREFKVLATGQSPEEQRQS